nr:coat protein [Erysiphe necator associated partitivirus 6]
MSTDDKTRTKLEYPSNDPTDKKIKNFDPDLYSIEDKAFPEKSYLCTPSPSDFIEYEEELNLYPHLLYFNPYEESSTDAWLSSVSGLTIESHDLAASIVPHPEDISHLGAQNSLFLQSAIAYHDIIPGSRFTVDNHHTVYARKREELRADSQPAASLLRLHTAVTIHTVTKTFVHTGYSMINQGLTLLQHVTMPEYFRNFYGLFIHDNSNHAHDEQYSPAATESHKSLVFSPYSYISRSYDPDWTNSSMIENEKKIYFLTNFRTVFGTDVTLQEIMHPFDAMPIA